MDPDAHPQGSEEKVTREPDFADVAGICSSLNELGAKCVLVGGFAIILHGFPRFTTDIDLLIEVGPDNEARVLEALARLPDGAARQVRPGEVDACSVVRIGDEVLVGLMKSGCGVTYEAAVKDAVTKNVQGVLVKVASQQTLWRMKQTLREKDIPDKIFLRQWAEQSGVQLDPPPQPAASAPGVDSWLFRLARRIERLLGKKNS
ncbi:MAG: nucleotidyltransferase [Verrucomicrobiaceae bacterium]|nr:nucleotidyltransferase [Verrucomicrobiaceae bacterium]